MQQKRRGQWHSWRWGCLGACLQGCCPPSRWLCLPGGALRAREAACGLPSPQKAFRSLKTITSKCGFPALRRLSWGCPLLEEKQRKKKATPQWATEGGSGNFAASPLLAPRYGTRRQGQGRGSRELRRASRAPLLLSSSPPSTVCARVLLLLFSIYIPLSFCHATQDGSRKCCCQAAAHSGTEQI